MSRIYGDFKDGLSLHIYIAHIPRIDRPIPSFSSSYAFQIHVQTAIQCCVGSPVTRRKTFRTGSDHPAVERLDVVFQMAVQCGGVLPSGTLT